MEDMLIGIIPWFGLVNMLTFYCGWIPETRGADVEQLRKPHNVLQCLIINKDMKMFFSISISYISVLTNTIRRSVNSFFTAALSNKHGRCIVARTIIITSESQ